MRLLAAGTNSQSLHVDGTLQGTVSGTLQAGSQAWTNVAAGAGFIDGNWPDTAATPRRPSGSTATLPSWPDTPPS